MTSLTNPHRHLAQAYRAKATEAAIKHCKHQGRLAELHDERRLIILCGHVAQEAQARFKADFQDAVEAHDANMEALMVPTFLAGAAIAGLEAAKTYLRGEA